MEHFYIPYADTVEKARSEAQHVVRLVQGKNLTYPIYYDMEDNSVMNKIDSTDSIGEYRTDIFKYDWKPMDIRM